MRFLAYAWPLVGLSLTTVLLLGALTFGDNLRTLIDRRSRWGINYDMSVGQGGTVDPIIDGVVGEGADAVAAAGGPPPVEARARVQPGMPGEVGEVMVGGQQVGQVGALGEVPAPAAGVVAAGDVFAALGGDDVDAELVEDVVVGVRAPSLA